MVCLPLEYLPGWLFGISTSRVKNDVHRHKIIHYRRECFRALSAAFHAELMLPVHLVKRVQHMVQARHLAQATGWVVMTCPR